MHRKKKIVSILGGCMVLFAATAFNYLKIPQTTKIQNQPPVNISTPSFSTSSPQYLVTRIVDGDTIQIETGQKVRYIGMNTPESVDPRKPVECFGKEASEKNKELVLNKKVYLIKDVSETDKYGRLLRYVYLEDGTFINSELVKQGYASVMTVPPDVKYSALFLDFQKQAKDSKLGLWSACK